MTILNVRERSLIARARALHAGTPQFSIPWRLIEIAERVDVTGKLSEEETAYVDSLVVRPALEVTSSTLLAILQRVRITLLERRLVELEAVVALQLFPK